MTDNEDTDFSDLLDSDGSESPERLDEKLDAKKLLAQLGGRERAILYLFACGDTQKEIAEKMGLSQPHIGRILKQIARRGVELYK